MEFAVKTIDLGKIGTYEYAEAGSGIPVVLLHGYLDSWYSFAGMAAAVTQ